ncbi:hypothetical protein BU23DRAFT_147562 [Bimuria novae-zelandiae CBS 107.79]|uniref:Secreted protein n=1 Tax=Bimuria novae-zelandiae CBS 107.79 TaxID=1447943 RepID=A0A6A5VI16_9PLEO|nr:hypothetical protein BU23DRAFT_147562 [Bimuria novae-zelandiae CBS 107.79]
MVGLVALWSINGVWATVQHASWKGREQCGFPYLIYYCTPGARRVAALKRCGFNLLNFEIVFRVRMMSSTAPM